MDTVISLKNISKTFYIREGHHDSIREKVFNLLKGDPPRSIPALKDISLDIKKGENFGIIGRNGSGKSTLLKLIIGAYRPDKGGRITVNGKVIRLALGMGFDPELSARDNIYVNGSILGLTFRQIGKKFDDIIGFAELEKFVDTQLKFYSSGMVSRLAFAVALHTEADIFLMDEFFGGVGDEGFKEKSEKVFQQSFVEGRTILYVSHQLDTIQEYCDRVLLLNMGEAVALGSPKEVLNQYKQFFH
ncbi:MAG: ABC transporter ATP-binding protein [Lewinellaceae bacterium]|nr:ABC transporter ATP-binding protein [Saprospiraceae bacterium]MCB9342043.1 ABC transporter ATP-binding protein [Lewinellaceae bacterium]